jgi:hypothetical protein
MTEQALHSYRELIVWQKGRHWLAEGGDLVGSGFFDVLAKRPIWRFNDHVTSIESRLAGPEQDSPALQRSVGRNL